eukprot:TRINITY_DN12986_c0_g2_i1.p1 TRINITY_DN12986_c0_g2~~TRINITY_DN12986_c0_g2_i1.p1  ORF type:complete len:333 (+),score=61.49 TRINITY_DN12986_c0_g2_i1:42-1040(+)
MAAAFPTLVARQHLLDSLAYQNLLAMQFEGRHREELLRQRVSELREQERFLWQELQRVRNNLRQLSKELGEATEATLTRTSTTTESLEIHPERTSSFSAGSFAALAESFSEEQPEAPFYDPPVSNNGLLLCWKELPLTNLPPDYPLRLEQYTAGVVGTTFRVIKGETAYKFRAVVCLEGTFWTLCESDKEEQVRAAIVRAVRCWPSADKLRWHVASRIVARALQDEEDVNVRLLDVVLDECDSAEQMLAYWKEVKFRSRRNPLARIYTEKLGERLEQLFRIYLSQWVQSPDELRVLRARLLREEYAPDDATKLLIALRLIETKLAIFERVPE